MEEKRYTLIKQTCSRVGMLLRDIATLIGTVANTWVKLETGALVAPGLGLTQEATHLLNCVHYLRQSACHIYVVGTCKAGKSTLINALLLQPVQTDQSSEENSILSSTLPDTHSTPSTAPQQLNDFVPGNSLLPTGPRPMTAVVTHIVYGPQEQVLIYEDGQDQLFNIDWPLFTRDYILPENLRGLIDAQGNIDSPLQHVKYAIVERPQALLEYGIRFIDTPGINVRLKRAVVTPYILKKQGTLIIVTLNAMNPFPGDVQELLAILQAANSHKHVFFVVNRIDQIAPTRVSEVKQLVQRTLRPYFCDQQGTFDLPLYQQRVFFTSADLALKARIASGDECQQLKESGIAELESAIELSIGEDDMLTQILTPTVYMLEQTLLQVYQHITRQQAVLAKAEHKRSGHFSVLREINRLTLLEQTLHQLVAEVKMATNSSAGRSLRQQIPVGPLHHPAVLDWSTEATTLEEHLIFAAQVVERNALPDAMRTQIYEIMQKILDRHIDPHFSIAIVGEFDSGKSTFINALLHQELLKTSALVATAITTHIRYGPVPDITVCFKGFRAPLTYTLDSARLQRFIRIFTQQEIPLGSDVRAYLHMLSANDSMATQVEQLVLSHPSPFLTEGMEIIDTPGLNAESPEHTKITTACIEQQADIVIVLIPASFPLSAVLQDFIKEQLLPLQKKCFFLLTQMDKIWEVEQQELVINNTRQRLSTIVGGEPPVFLEGMAARMIFETTYKGREFELTRQHWSNSFTKLENKLWDSLHKERVAVQRKQVSDSLRQLFWQLDKYMHDHSLALNNVCTSDFEDVEKRLLKF